MELLTDVFAICGWALFGRSIPFLIMLRGGATEITVNDSFVDYCALSFGIIAASLVLG